MNTPHPTYLLCGDAEETRDLMGRAAVHGLHACTVQTPQHLPALPGDAVVYASALSTDVYGHLEQLMTRGLIHDLLPSFFLPLKDETRHPDSLPGPSINGPNINGPSINGPSINGPSINGPSINVTGDALHALKMTQVARSAGFEHDVRVVHSPQDLGPLPPGAVVTAQHVTPQVTSALRVALQRGTIRMLFLL